MAVGQRADDVQIPAIGRKGFAFEYTPQGFDLRGWPIGNIRQCAFPHLAAFAKRFSQQSGWGGVAIGNTFDIHGHDYLLVTRIVNINIDIYMATAWPAINLLSRELWNRYPDQTLATGGNFGLGSSATRLVNLGYSGWKD